MKPKITAADWDLAEKEITNYANARIQFRKTQKTLESSGLLAGNDNKVGIIGEYWAKRFYYINGFNIIEIPSLNNEGWDFSVEKKGLEIKVSVKVVSEESKHGKQLPLKESKNWDEICLILLNEKMQCTKIGIATLNQFHKAQSLKYIGPKPCVARSWVGARGWIAKVGKITEGPIF